MNTSSYSLRRFQGLGVEKFDVIDAGGRLLLNEFGLIRNEEQPRLEPLRDLRIASRAFCSAFESATAWVRKFP